MPTEYEEIAAVINARQDTSVITIDMTDAGDTTPIIAIEGDQSMMLVTVDQYAGHLSATVQTFDLDGNRTDPDATIVTT